MAGPFVNQQIKAQNDQRDQAQSSQMMQMGYYAAMAKQRDEAQQDSWLKGQMNIVNSDLPEQLKAQALTAVYRKMGMKDVQVTPEWFTPLAGTMNDMIKAKGEGRDLSEFLPRLELIMKQPGLIPYAQRNQLPELATAVQDDAAKKTAALVVPELTPVQEAKARLQRAQDPADSDLQLYGGYDGWRNQNLRDQALVDRESIRDGQRQRTYEMLRLNPSATSKVLDGALKVGLKPEELAASTAYDLVSTVPLEDMDPSQKRYVEAYYRVFKPDQADKMGFETAAGKQARLQGELEQVQGRSALVGQASTLVNGHTETADQMTLNADLLRGNAELKMPQAKADALRTEFTQQAGQLAQSKQAFDQGVQPLVQTFGLQSETQGQTVAMLEKQLAGLSPGDRTIVQGKIDDSRRIQKSSQAMTRLLSDLSPYAIAEKRMQLGLLTTELQMLKEESAAHPELLKESAIPDQHSALQKQVETMELDRTKALATVEQEQAYLLKQETVTSSKLKAMGAQKDAEDRVRVAATAAFKDHVINGTSWNVAAVNASNQFGADLSKVAKITNDFQASDEKLNISAAETQAQNHLLAWQKQHPGKEPAHADLLGITTKVAKQYPGVKPKELMDALRDPNRAPVQVNMADKASDEAARDFMKSTRGTYDQLKTAPILLRNIDEAKALIPQAKGFMGPGGEPLLEAAKFLNSRLNARIDVQGIKSAEELRTRIFFNIMENLKKMDAQPSEMQQMMMRDALGKLGTDPNALAAVLDAYGDTIRDKVDLFNNEVSGAMKKGTEFPYDPRIVLPDRKAASGEPVVKSEAEYNKLPSGSVYIGPDGKKRTKK